MAIEIADRVTLVDNTEIPIECAKTFQGNIQRTVPSCPAWVETIIGSVTARKESRDTWQQLVSIAGQPIVIPDVWTGSYQGEILQADDHYLLQAVSQDLILHDRLLLKSDYSIGQVPEIFYQEGLA